MTPIGLRFHFFSFRTMAWKHLCKFSSRAHQQQPCLTPLVHAKHHSENIATLQPICCRWTFHKHHVTRPSLFPPACIRSNYGGRMAEQMRWRWVREGEGALGWFGVGVPGWLVSSPWHLRCTCGHRAPPAPSTSAASASAADWAGSGCFVRKNLEDCFTFITFK